MPRFRYLAKNMEGRTLRGTTDAADERALQQQLKEQGLFLVDAKDVTVSKSARRCSSKQLSEFCKELSALLASGISIVRALEIIAEEEGLPVYARSVYLSVLADLRKGTSLSEAMETKNYFPELMLGMIRSGEGSGNMDTVMERLAMHFDRESRLKNQVKSALVYPAVLLVMCAAVVVLIVTFILPQFNELFSQMESLPAVTRWLMGASDFLVNQWYLALLVIFLLAVALRIILKIYKIRRVTDYLKIHMPVVGRLNKIIYTARFARTLSSLYSSGMPILAALQTAGRTIGNVYVEEQFEQVTAEVRSGVALSQALKPVDGLVRKLPVPSWSERRAEGWIRCWIQLH